MTLGDVLEALGLAAAAAAAYLQWGLTAGLVALAVALVYEGNCFGSTRLPLPAKKPSADNGQIGEGDA